MLQLSEKDLNELQAYINKIPTEFGLPLLNFFGKLAEDQKPKDEAKIVDLKED
jgi:hypothetical protein